MGIIYIGDRATGKTHLAMELANPLHEYVKVTSPDYEALKSSLCDPGDPLGRTRPTKADSSAYPRNLDLQVKLPSTTKEVLVDWVDTPGEIWRQSWQDNNSDQWQHFIDKAKYSEGILLVVPPYREIIKPGENMDEFLTEQQWSNRFDRWSRFITIHCQNVRHILICLNKADLFCDYQQEGKFLAYNPYSNQLNWQDRHNYVWQKYFQPIHPQLEHLNKTLYGVSIRCFITTIYQRNLLELPWIYLGSFLAKKGY
jgi:hypothetical protein